MQARSAHPIKVYTNTIFRHSVTIITCGEQSQGVFLKVTTLSKKRLTWIIESHDYCHTPLVLAPWCWAHKLCEEWLPRLMNSLLLVHHCFDLIYCSAIGSTTAYSHYIKLLCTRQIYSKLNYHEWRTRAGIIIHLVAQLSLLLSSKDYVSTIKQNTYNL